jgi:hypothetical protein
MTLWPSWLSPRPRRTPDTASRRYRSLWLSKTDVSTSLLFADGRSGSAVDGGVAPAGEDLLSNQDTHFACFGVRLACAGTAYLTDDLAACPRGSRDAIASATSDPGRFTRPGLV